MFKQFPSKRLSGGGQRLESRDPKVCRTAFHRIQLIHDRQAVRFCHINQRGMATRGFGICFDLCSLQLIREMFAFIFADRLYDRCKLGISACSWRLLHAAVVILLQGSGTAIRRLIIVAWSMPLSPATNVCIIISQFYWKGNQ